MTETPERTLRQIRSAISFLISNPNELSQRVALGALIDLCAHVERIDEEVNGLKTSQSLASKPTPASSSLHSKASNSKALKSLKGPKK